MKKLETMTAEQLQSAPYAPVPFLVDELIPEGLHILAGAPKIGKSWLALWLCLCVSQGQPLWNFAVTQGDVLYLSLEDSYRRIQSRLFDLTEDAPPTLHFAIMADTLKHGLEQQIEQFLSEHPATKLVVIDTLQRVRSAGGDSNLYANDYQDVGLLKQLADKHHIAILLIHHLRKLHDDDPMNMISGSTGLSGAADSAFVLQKNARNANAASLHCTGRDIPDRTLKLELGEDDHVWKLLSDSKTCTGASKISALQIENLLSGLLREQTEISAPAKALLEKIDPAGIEGWTPNSLSHQIRKNVDSLRKTGILVSFRKSNGERLICLKRADGADLPTVGNIDPIDPTEALAAQHKKSMDEARRLEPAVMVTERNWNAMLKMQHDLFQQQMQLGADLKTLLTREEAQESLIKMQTSAAEFEKQAGRLNERYSSSCKTLTESTKLALTEILNDTKKQLSDTVQEARKKIRLCAWVSITAVICCAALCALSVLWSR